MTDSNRALQDLLSASANVSPFAANSRYYGLQLLEYMPGLATPTIRYLARRFIQPPDRFKLLVEHSVLEGQRLDNLASHYLGDPQAFWRICDANAALRPDELTETIGQRIRITLPSELSGT